MDVRKLRKGTVGTERIREVCHPNSVKEKQIIPGIRFLIPEFWWTTRIHGIKVLHSYGSDRGVACKHYL